MKERYEIGSTRETPSILFDKNTGLFQIQGRSLPENSFNFYNPSIEWLKEYIHEPKDATILEVYLEYLNSGSLKQLFRIMYVLEDLIELGFEAKIVWKYEKGDDLMLEKGKEFKQFLIIPIELEEI